MHDTEPIPWKRDTSHLIEKSVHELEEGAFEVLALYDAHGPEHPDAEAWCNAALDIVTRLRELALQKSSRSILQLAQQLGSEAQAVTNQFNAARMHKAQQSKIVRATGGGPPPDSPRWRK